MDYLDIRILIHNMQAFEKEINHKKKVIDRLSRKIQKLKYHNKVLHKGVYIQKNLKEYSYNLLIRSKAELNNLIEELSWVNNTDEEIRNTKIIVKLNKIAKILEGKDE